MRQPPEPLEVCIHVGHDASGKSYILIDGQGVTRLAPVAMEIAVCTGQQLSRQIVGDWRLGHSLRVDASDLNRLAAAELSIDGVARAVDFHHRPSATVAFRERRCRFSPLKALADAIEQVQRSRIRFGSPALALPAIGSAAGRSESDTGGPDQRAA